MSIQSDFSDRVLRLADVCAMTGLSKSSLFRLVQRGAFPKSYALAGNRVGWKMSEVQAWIDALPVAEPEAVQGNAAKARAAHAANVAERRAEQVTI